MAVNFLTIARELRNNIYERILLQQEPIDPWWAYGRQLDLGLCLVNKTIHDEASSTLYGQNCFDFVLQTPDDISSFLEQIGSCNAGYIRHVRIDFPSFEWLEPGGVVLDDESLRTLAVLKRFCINLSTLTTSLDSTTLMELKIDDLDRPGIIPELFELVDNQFRDISSIQEILTEIYEEGPIARMRQEMTRRGWKIQTKERVEAEEEDDVDQWSDGYSRGQSSDFSNNSYDVDNDSDYWRRTAD